MTPSKEMVLYRLNEAAQVAHAEAVDVARRKGRPAPPAPVPLTEIEFPKHLHKDWKLSGKAAGHYEAKESRVAANAEEMKELVALGFSEEAPKPPAKEAPKKV